MNVNLLALYVQPFIHSPGQEVVDTLQDNPPWKLRPVLAPTYLLTRGFPTAKPLSHSAYPNSPGIQICAVESIAQFLENFPNKQMCYP